MTSTVRLNASHLVAATLGAAISIVVVLWVLASRPDRDTRASPAIDEGVRTAPESTSAVASSPSLDTSSREPAAEPSPSIPVATSPEDLAAFEKTLFPKEKELIAAWGGDLESYREYKLASTDAEAYEDKSFAYALTAYCRAAAPEVVYERMVQPFLRESVDASTKQSVDQELQQFSTEFNRQRHRLKHEYGLDVPAPNSIAERTAEQKQERAMWSALDDIVVSINCEWQLQSLVGRPSKGSVYLCLENARRASR